MGRIYTKKGDKGKTQLLGGKVVDKSDPRVEAYGTLDELNSFLGYLLTALIENPDLKMLCAEVEEIQKDIFHLGSLFACDSQEMRTRLTPVRESDVLRLERNIDKMTEQLPELRGFVHPGGSSLSALFHVCRTIARRAERGAVLIAKEGELEQERIYLNRLSDYFFTAARFCNLKTHVPEKLFQ